MASDNPIIFMGATISELAEMFRMDRKEVRKRISDLPPKGKRLQSDVWQISDVAARLLRFDDTMTDLVSKVLATHHTDLPKMLSKEYWYGQNQRVNFLQRIGDLWDTAAVVELASEVFKTLRLSMMLASDAVERETGLTDRQRGIIEDIMREALNDAREKLVVSLNTQRENSRGKAFAPQESGVRHGSSDERDEWDDPIVRVGDSEYI